MTRKMESLSQQASWIVGASLGISLGLVSIIGCSQPSREDGAPQSPAAHDASAYRFVFAGPGGTASSRVERAPLEGGRERLHGETEIHLDSAHTYVVHEDVVIEASGRMSWAKVSLSEGMAAAPTRTIELDPSAQAVRAQLPDGDRSWSVAADMPWAYEGLFGDVAPALASATAVQAWVMLRAAETGSWLHVVGPTAEATQRMAADQLVFADGAARFIVIGDEVVEADRRFVSALPWKAFAQGCGHAEPGAPQRLAF